MDIKEEILVQMDSALRPEFDKAIDNTIERAFEEDVKTLGFMVANSIKCQWEVMKPHLFYAYCLGVKAQEAKAQAVPEGFVLVSAEQLSQWSHMASCAEEYGCPECFEARGYAHSLACEINAYFNTSETQEPAND